MKLIIINLFHLLLHVISIHYQVNAFSIKMIPIDSSHLKMVPHNLTTKERTQSLIDLTVSRSFYANKRNANRFPKLIKAPFASVPGFFVTQVFVGSGDDQEAAYDRYLLLDLFSDETWFQCAGCNPCIYITTGDVIAGNSPSYVRMQLNDSRCYPQISYQGSCGFIQTYGTGRSKGFLGSDNFRFTNAEDQYVHFPNLAFGCGMFNTGFPFRSDNIVAGVFGLAPGPRSFLRQLDQQIKGRFSYCVPFTAMPDKGMSSVTFGDDAQIAADGDKVVQQIGMNAQARYHLYLSGISLDGTRLPINESMFKLDDVNFSSGFFINPGVPFTVLTKTPYSIVKDAMMAHFSQFGFEPLPVTALGPDLCYPQRPDEQKYPSFSFHFKKTETSSEEVELQLDSGINLFSIQPDGHPNGFCMTIQPAPENGPSMLGAYQQMNQKFLFDVYNGELSFVPQVCQQG